MNDSRILVVEDDSVVSDYLRLCLMLMGYTVVDVCCRGEEAILKATEFLPDLILMDIKLQGSMSGLEAAQTIRRNHDIPVVYLTGYGDDDLLQSAKITEPFGYLLKPFRENDLKNVIEIALHRHGMAKALKERETSYRILAESLPGIVYRFFFTPHPKTVFFNEMLETMTGFKEDELIAGRYSCIDSLLLPEDRSFVDGIVAKAICDDKPFEVEYRIRHKDGTIRYFLERGKGTTTRKDGEMSFIDSVILDITERKLAEEKLEQAYLKLVERQTFIESILSNIQSGIIVTDLSYRTMLMNPSAEQFLGVSASAVIGDDLSLICPTFSEAVRKGNDDSEIPCTACGREHIFGFKIFDMKGKDGDVNGHIISFADLTEIVKIRQEMKLKERLASMGEFVARVAHEIRNPLFGMTAICQIFSMELNLSETHQKLMDSMMKEAWRLKHLVEELLDCSREIRVMRKDCDLIKIIDESIFENDLVMKEKGIIIERAYEGETFNIIADPDKIKQVVINLLKNAVEASHQNGTISVALARGGGGITFRISDRGSGIPDTIKDKIFDVFYTTKRHGTGLGLAICKNIIVAHGGTLKAENRAEGGSTFAFAIPSSA